MAETQIWSDYLASFHSDRSGITETVLRHALDDTGKTPYDWLAEIVGPASSVLDLACGSGPMRSRVATRSYVGLDLSLGELSVAAARSLPVAQADASRLPIGNDSVDVVVMSMALMLVPFHATLVEIRRVLRIGGLFAATVPTNRPVRAADWVRYARLCVALRHRGLSYPNDGALTVASEAFETAGLRLESDERRLFVCSLKTDVVADQLLASLYLPERDAPRLSRGQQVVRHWVGSSIGSPIRRLVARRVS